jgi:CRP/FNR family cyclic AMP-dependent transcriptional regulator
MIAPFRASPEDRANAFFQSRQAAYMRKALIILGQLHDDDIEWLIANGARRRVSAGDTLIRQGTPIDSLYVVLDGKLSVRDERHPGGRELSRLAAGDIVGEMSFVDARPPSASVTALSDSQVLTLDRGGVRAHLDADPAFAARFYRAIATFLSDRLRATVDTLSYGAPVAGVSDEEQADELDLTVLESMHLAGARFDQIVKRARP